MTFKKGNKISNNSFYYQNRPIENVKTFKYLGISLNNKGNFLPSFQDLSNKAYKAIYSLNNKVNLKFLSVKVKLKLFDYFIRPILLYGSEVWLPYVNHKCSKWDENAIEKVHLAFLKRVLGVNRSTTNALVRAELGRFSLKENGLQRNFNYVKYLNGKESSSIVRQAFDYELRNFDKRDTILTSLAEFNEKIDEELNCHLNLFQLSPLRFKNEVNKIALLQWELSFKNSTKCETYSLFKTYPSLEKHLEDNIQFKYVKSLSKFRLSDHKLMIEEGRRAIPKVPREDRKCEQCNIIEDEIHFLIDCDKHAYQRESAFQAIQNIVPNFKEITNSKDKFIFLMSQENIKVSRILANFIFENLMIR